MNKIKDSCAWQCHNYPNYYSREDEYERYLEDFSCIPRIAYYFDTQNLVNFEVNLKHKVDLHLVAHCSFEATAPTDSCLDSENTKKKWMLYHTLSFSFFHPELNLCRVIKGK